MYIWGLDLSITRVGITIFEGDKPVLITSVAPNPNDKDLNEFGARLYTIGKELIKLKKKYPPTIVIIERGFTRFNTATQVTYRTHGLANYIFYDVGQIYYPPTTVKATILHGKASKEMIENKIKEKYDVQFSNHDESDSFAVVLTFLIKKGRVVWE